MLIGCDYLHRICGIIHTDLKLENIAAGLPSSAIEQLKSKHSNLIKDKGFKNYENSLNPEVA
jgi:serine/threonine protein kinase